MIPGRGHDQTVLEGIESLNEQNAATILSCEKIISTEPNHVIVIIILCTRLVLQFGDYFQQDSSYAWGSLKMEKNMLFDLPVTGKFLV